MWLIVYLNAISQISYHITSSCLSIYFYSTENIWRQAGLVRHGYNKLSLAIGRKRSDYWTLNSYYHLIWTKLCKQPNWRVLFTRLQSVFRIHLIFTTSWWLPHIQWEVTDLPGLTLIDEKVILFVIDSYLTYLNYLRYLILIYKKKNFFVSQSR